MARFFSFAIVSETVTLTAVARAEEAPNDLGRSHGVRQRHRIGYTRPGDPPVEDLEPPVITHEDPGEVLPGRVTIKLKVEDTSPLFAVVFHWRYVDETSYRQVELAGRHDNYTAELDVTGPFEFWVEAFDEKGNGPGLDGTDLKPIRVNLAAPPKPVDNTPPVIGCIPPETVSVADNECWKGPCAEFLIRIRDESGVFGATLNWRNVGESQYRQINLSGADAAGYYRRRVGPVYGDLEFWIEAYDEHGNGPAIFGTSAAPVRVKIKGITAGSSSPAPAAAAPEPPWYCKLLFFLPCCP